MLMFSSDSCSRNLCVFVMYDIKRMEGSRITQGRSSTYISLVRAPHTSPISHLPTKSGPSSFHDTLRHESALARTLHQRDPCLDHRAAKREPLQVRTIHRSPIQPHTAHHIRNPDFFAPSHDFCYECICRSLTAFYFDT